MFRRLRTTSLAGSGALVLVLVVSGMVAAASILTAVAAPVADPTEPTVVDTTATFEDLNGNGIDDDCEEAVEADQEAADAAAAAVDLNGDGTVSVSEAAQSDRTGGVNCNHGGYVSGVAQETCPDADSADGTDADADGSEDADTGEVDADEAAADGSEDAETDEAEAPDGDCDAPEEEQPAEETAEDAPTCDAEAPTGEETTTEGTEPAEDTSDEAPAPNAHGKAVSKVAQSDAVGGKNCNHGGAVSEAAHADKEAREAARDAAKAAREAAREAKHASKGGKGKGHNH
jgi:hypothetical protein